jgi:hypothetical protein
VANWKRRGDVWFAGDAVFLNAEWDWWRGCPNSCGRKGLQAFPPVFFLISNKAFDIFCRLLCADKPNMTVLNPSGRLSKVEAGDKVFQIQTEFYQRPARKITTTVILNGKTLNKLDTPWEGELLTDEDLKRIEKALRQQHHAVTQRIEKQKEKPKDERPDETLLMKSWIGLSEAQGVENLVVIDAQGEILHKKTGFQEMEAVTALAGAGIRLARVLSQSTRLGEFSGGQIKLKREKIAWIYKENKICFAWLNQKTDLSSFLGKAKQTESEKKVE